jgi:hypothetical protein
MFIIKTYFFKYKNLFNCNNKTNTLHNRTTKAEAATAFLSILLNVTVVATGG